MSIRCVGFDVDDTLFLERDYVVSGFRAVDRFVRERLGVGGLLTAALRECAAGRRGDVLDVVLPELGLEPTPELVSTLVHCYRHHRPSIALLPDALQALDAAAATAVVAVVTDGPAASQRQKVRALGLRRWAGPVVVTAESFPATPKPSPVPFAHVQDVVGVSGADCVYVADNPAKDFAGPKRLGWRTVRVRRPGGLHEHLPSGDDVDVEVRSLEGLRALVRLPVSAWQSPIPASSAALGTVPLTGGPS